MAALIFVLLCAIIGGADSLRVPGSPFPVPGAGLNATREILLLSLDGLSSTDVITATTMQGAVSARRRAAADPVIYRHSGDSDYMLWLNVTTATWPGVTVNSTFTNDLPHLLARVAPLLSGYVRFDASSGDSVNAALAVCSALGTVAVAPANEAMAVAAGLKLVADATGKDTAWAISTYNGTAASNGFSFSRRVTTIQDPSKAGCMSDYSISTGALQWWVADDSAPLATRIWSSMTAPFAGLGWGPTERGTVGAASKAGGGVVASDWATNLDVLSSFDVPALAQKPSPAPSPPARAVHTAAFLMSDGDNVQWLLGGFARDPAHYGSSDRGRVAMGWTISPAVVDLAPAMMQHVYAAAQVRSTGSMHTCRATYSMTEVRRTSDSPSVSAWDAGRCTSDTVSLHYLPPVGRHQHWATLPRRLRCWCLRYVLLLP